jgi:molybdopterin synthase catalytic subunit
MTDSKEDVWDLSEDICHVGITKESLNIQAVMDKVRSPQAGAIVLFAGKPIDTPPNQSPPFTSQPCSRSFCSCFKGTTRDNFAGKPVKELQYTSYNALALRTMMDICKNLAQKHGLKGIAMIHRLGTVPIGEESILIAVSSPHRQAAWRAGEEALEECKQRVEVWKREEFEDDGGVWRANRDGAVGEKIEP